MNRIYKSVWNEQTATFVAVAENTKARGKRSSGGACASQTVLEWLQGLRLRTVALALLSAGVVTQPAMAQITDGWELAVDGAAPFHVIPGGAFSLTLGNNIALTQTGGTVAVALNPDLNVDSVTASGLVKVATVQGNLQANTATITNQLTAGSVSAGAGPFTGGLTAPSAIIDGNIAAKSASAVGSVNSGGVITVSLTATGNSSLRAVNVNNNKISGLADAAVSASSTKAISGKVLYGVLNSGDGIKYFHGSSTKADSVVSGTDSTAIGPQATSSGEAALAAGLESEVTGKEAIALGARSGTGNTVENGIAIGSDAGTTSKGSDLTRVASLRTEQGQHLVRFQLNSLGARKLAEVSSGNVGPLLVLVMEDQVAQVARIGEPLKQGMIYLSMPDDAAAQRLLRQVQG
ncbi:ESPR-type extended signal peptide-containing protein [Alcaligenes faecalis]|uniref:ESPR-type extended signal peptide-containing protein n=1 Tax=Alcaligenes TaxID=507 RepID=UPI002882ABED|nr:MULTISPECIES: ESPR-type extended signal peptide-containing protein [Alcaligenes]MDT0216708.1 ESPR-type extended signal peptide-containing protein [Alcaligenes sp. AB3]